MLCHDDNFWINKFNHDNLPLLYKIYEENRLKSMEDLINEFENPPKTWQEWENLYKTTIYLMNVSEKFVNDNRDGDFQTFNTPEIKFYDYLWFPVEWFNYYRKMEKLEKKGIYVNVNISYNVNKYIIYFSISDIDSFKVYKSFKLKLSKDEFIEYIAKLIYHNQDYDEDELFIVNEDGDDPEALFITDFIKK